MKPYSDSVYVSLGGGVFLMLHVQVSVKSAYMNLSFVSTLIGPFIVVNSMSCSHVKQTLFTVHTVTCHSRRSPAG